MISNRSSYTNSIALVIVPSWGLPAAYSCLIVRKIIVFPTHLISEEAKTSQIASDDLLGVAHLEGHQDDAQERTIARVNRDW